jgi:hypothetical protein
MIRGEIQRFRLQAASVIALVLSAATSFSDDAYPSDLADIDRHIEEVVVQGDLERLQQLYTEDFQFTHATGEVQSKAEWLAYVAERPFSDRTVSDVQIESHGVAALTTGRITVTERGPPAGGYTLRYIRLYVLVDGRWHLASHHTIEIHDDR